MEQQKIFQHGNIPLSQIVSVGVNTPQVKLTPVYVFFALQHIFLFHNLSCICQFFFCKWVPNPFTSTFSCGRKLVYNPSDKTYLSLFP